ncbi:MAG: CBS domain-containing protein [Deltaproteobacteria bacterium]|nr:CBS domain-containing protein [Deltaproteobacteria bacterium]
MLVACGTAAAVAHSRLGGSIYALGARRRGVILPVQGAALSELEVGMALDRVEPVPAELLLSDLLPRLLEQPGQAFPVTNDAQQLVGIFSIAAARHALLTRELHTLRVREVMRPALPRFVTDDDLQVALHTLAEGDAAAGLVVDEHGRSLGVITREGILEAWRRSTIAEEQH